MALTINKQPAAVAAQPATVIGYLSPELSAQVLALPDQGIVAKYQAATALTPALIEETAPGLPESLMDGLITYLEQQLAETAPATAAAPVAPAPTVAAPVAPPADSSDRKAQRDALKAQIQANSGQPATVKQAVEKPVLAPEIADAAPTMPPSTAIWDQLFPPNMPVIIVNRGGGRFEMTVGKDALVAAKTQAAETVAEEAKKGKKESGKPKASDVVWNLMTDEYFTWINKIKTEYPTLDARIQLAESLGLKRGETWASTTKDGKPLPEGIENMYIMDPLRKAMGVEKYIEGARTDEERRAIINGTAPMPAGAKPRKKGTGELIIAEAAAA